MKKHFLNLLYGVLFATPIIPLEILHFHHSNILFATFSFLLIFLTSFIFLFNETGGGFEKMIGLSLPTFLYVLYWVHTWYGYLVLMGFFGLLFLFGAIVFFKEERKLKKRNRLLQDCYPLEAKTLKSDEMAVLSSLYGKKGHYYKVIQSGTITQRDAEAINGKIRGILNIR